MNPYFQLSTRNYDSEIILVRKALDELQDMCCVKDCYVIEEPFVKFGWTFFNIKLDEQMTDVIEKSGMMEGALGYKIGEQLTNFVGHHLESHGSNVRIKQINY